MHNLLTNPKKLAVLLCAVFAVIIALSAVLAPAFSRGSSVVAPGSSSLPPESSASADDTPDGPDAETPPSELALPDDDIETAVHNFPAEMRAIYLTPGEDYLTEGNTSETAIKSAVDDFLNKAQEMSMNTVVVPLNNDKGVVYDSTTLPHLSDYFDAFEYIVTSARARGLYVYGVYELLTVYDGHSLITAPYYNAAVINGIRTELLTLADYAPDGIFFANFDNPETTSSYSAYVSYGGGIGYDTYMGMVSRSAVKEASETLRANAAGIQIGLLTGPQWAAQVEKEEGSKTFAAYSSCTDGNCDVKAFLEDGLADMVAVEAFGSLSDGKIPFETVVKWWADVAQKNDVRLYVVQASDRICTGNTGWGAADQLTRQIIAARTIEGYGGTIFNDFQRLIENPNDAMTRLVKYYNEELDAKYILTELAVTKPTSNEYNTFETTVTFMGASDATMPLTLDGAEVERDSSGYFSINRELKAGLNTFSFKHKEKTITFKITRVVQVIQSVAPTGTMSVDGGTAVTLSVYAYEGSTVTAAVSGTTVSMSKSEEETDETDGESSYVLYVGTYTTPASSSAVQNLGSISFKAVHDGTTATETGAAITVNKAVAIGTGSPVIVTAEQARTYPYNTLDNYTASGCFALPKGALDYTVGSAVVYTSGSTTYRYYKLESGMRVNANDLSTTSTKVSGVKITGMTIDSKTSDSYTYVKLPMSQNASYKVSYSSTGISFSFNYVSSVPGSLKNIGKYNALFSDATWSGTTLTLKFRQSNGMMGYRAYYQSGQLVLRFNNPPDGYSDLKIVIDPGHGGTDPGALGFYPESPEKAINLAVAKKVTNQLKNKGASVKMFDTSGSSKITIQTRLAAAEEYAPQLYISIHCNSATTSSAKGNETYYFYEFSRPLANVVNNNVYSVMSNANRGVKYGIFYVTTSSQFSSILTELGFMSNESEYKKLLNDSTQSNLASAIVSAVGSYISNLRSGSYTASVLTDGAALPDAVTGVTLDKTKAEVPVGGMLQLTAAVAPEDAADKTVKWTSSNTKIATVSETGLVTGIKEGTATVTVTCNADTTKTATCAVTVTKSAGITEVKLDRTAADVTVGGTLQLTAAVLPDTAADKTVTWATSDAKVATVSESGLVTGVKEGTATITVTCKADTTKTAACTVTVKKAVVVTGVELDKETLTLSEKGTAALTATVLPDTAADKTVTWTSKDAKIATVDAAGKVTGIKAGTTTVTAASKADPTKKAECTVTVVVPVEDVSLNHTTATMQSGGDTLTLTATVTPAAATDTAVTWHSSNTAYATVENGVVTAAANLTEQVTVTITVKTVDGGKTATCKITISPVAVQPPESSTTASETTSGTEPSSETTSSEPSTSDSSTESSSEPSTPDAASSDATSTSIE